MARIYFVRHGEAAAGFGSHKDPTLSDLGIQQAQATANYLAEFGSMDIFSSPLQRAKETADELAKLWNIPIQIANRVAEVPSPNQALETRSTWLTKIMQGTWSSLSRDLMIWRQEMIDFAESRPTDCVVFSHFVAINILVGYAEGSYQMVSFHPGNASITEFNDSTGKLRVVSKGSKPTPKSIDLMDIIYSRSRFD